MEKRLVDENCETELKQKKAHRMNVIQRKIEENIYTFNQQRK